MISRRAWLGAASLAGMGCAQPVLARSSTFASDWGAAPGHRFGQPAALPLGYAVMGQRHGVPPLVLYGVALQESAKLFGPYALPWPWTLNVQGKPVRYNSYSASVAGMRSFIASGVRNVDAGLMQVNWGYHRDKLLDPAQALDPYPNMAVGARILQGHFASTGNWYTAVGRYHSPGNAERAANYAALVYRRMAQVPNAPAHVSPGQRSAPATRVLTDRWGAGHG